MKQTFTITLEGRDDDRTPAVIRLRQLLKMALRGYRLRCVACQEIGSGEISAGSPEKILAKESTQIWGDAQDE